MQSTVKDRLMLFIEHKGISVRQFERETNLSNGYVRGIDKTIMPNKLEGISLQYSELNTGWLLTGEGEMLNTSVLPTPSNEEVIYVPLLPISAQGGTLNDFIVSVKDSDCEKIVSPIKGADWAINVSGDSMAPEYPSGSQILIKKINEKAFIDWGKVYVLDTCNGVVIKRLFPGSEVDRVECRSINPDYPPFEVSLTDVFGVYRVMLCMSIK